jgi:DNA-binding MarR family transcriptional regulator
MQSKDLPIGYWLKKTDALLTEKIDAIHAEVGLDRTRWQILNCLSEKKKVLLQEIISLLKPFANAQTISGEIDWFKDQDLVGEDKIGLLSLSEKGQELHWSAFVKQKTFRAQSMDGISENEYRTTIETLKKMVSNLERS